MFKKFTTQFTLTLLVFIVAVFLFSITGQADTNIDQTNRWAWSDSAGWWDFYDTGTVEVDGQELRGYATSSIGAMVLNCNSSPSGDICSDSNFRVTNPDATGDLSGCAWNDTIGWISFWCGDTDCDGDNVEGDADSICTSSEYRVSIEGGGEFTGYAWNDIEGWISFNCSNDSSCGSTDYKLETEWEANRIEAYLTSSIIDTGTGGGVTLKSIVWQGTQPAGTDVDFQVAVSNSDSGPWNFTGPGESSENWYGTSCENSPTGGGGSTVGPDVPICVDRRITENNRYVRYRVRLQTDLAQDETPVVENIILNWSE